MRVRSWVTLKPKSLWDLNHTGRGCESLFFGGSHRLAGVEKHGPVVKVVEL